MARVQEQETELGVDVRVLRRQLQRRIELRDGEVVAGQAAMDACEVEPRRRILRVRLGVPPEVSGRILVGAGAEAGDPLIQLIRVQMPSATRMNTSPAATASRRVPGSMPLPLSRRLRRTGDELRIISSSSS